jgi:hypothetical protein
MIHPQLGDRVYIIPTGDPNIDRFLDQPMIVIDVKPVRFNRYAHFDSYMLQSEDYRTCSVLDCEMEYRNV